jgi:hypothetical protein
MTTPSMLPHLTAHTVGIQLPRPGHTSEKNSQVLSNGSIKSHNFSSFFFCVDVKFVFHQWALASLSAQKIGGFLTVMITRISLMFPSIFINSALLGFFLLGLFSFR